MKIALPLLIALITLFSINAFADPYISFDKSSYNYGDTVKISGNVEYQQGMFVIIQVRSSSDIVAIAQLFPSSSGEFSSTFTAEGPKWQEPGTYNVLVSYAGQKVEKSFQFSKSQENPTDKTQTGQELQPLEKPKIVVKGFPDPTKSPQHYYDRYNNEPEFKRLLDTRQRMFLDFQILITHHNITLIDTIMKTHSENGLTYSFQKKQSMISLGSPNRQG